MNTTSTLRRFAAAATIAAVIGAMCAPAASADNGRSLGEIATTTTTTVAGGPTTPRPGKATTTTAAAPSTTTTTAPASALNGEGLEVRYRSLAAGLVAAYASATGTDLSSLLAASGNELNTALGSAVLDGDTDTLDELEGRISGAGLLPGSTPGGSLAETIAAAGAGPDAVGILANINLANRAAGLDTPELAVPKLGANQLTSPGMVSAGQLSAVPADSLVFGLFQNQALAQFANSAPNLFAQVSSSGLTDPAARAAWDRSRANAASAVTQGLGSSLISPCHAAMMASMATGNGAAGSAITPQGADCSPCIAAGVYMSGTSNRILASGSGNPLPEDDGIISPSEWNLMPQWQRDVMGGNRIAGTQDRALANSGAGTRAQAQCRASAAGTSGYLGQNLPSVLRSLGG